MNRLRRSTENVARRPCLWLAAVDGERLPAPRGIAPIGQAEHPLEIEFVGLTPEQQLRALAFPGGRRFVLKGVAAD